MRTAFFTGLPLTEFSGEMREAAPALVWAAAVMANVWFGPEQSTAMVLAQLAGLLALDALAPRAG